MLMLPRRLLRQNWLATKLQSTAAYHSKSGVYGYRPPRDKSTSEEVLCAETIENRIKHSNAYALVQNYRRYGHKLAKLDPLGLKETQSIQQLNPSRYGISGDNEVADINVKGILHCGYGYQSPKELIENLQRQYCGHIGAEFEHLENEVEREWFAHAFETKDSIEVSAERQIALAKLMLRCQTFDQFLASKFTTVKRYGGEGCESMMAAFDEIFSRSSNYGVTDVVMCMPHRGRLNFLTTMLDFPPVRMFRKMKGLTELPPMAKGSGDVLSHLYTSQDLKYGDNTVHVSLIPNPSHLEANNPVAVGKARAKIQSLKIGDYGHDSETQSKDVLCFQVHGDASFSAQGIISETFSFAECAHFSVGGSIHLIVNNQIGFTTEAERGRSSRYCSDQAKINGYPVLHVNADDPKAIIQAAAIAVDYRQQFHRDVIIDLVCFRRWGHNELDDPMFTQPIMYKAVESRMSIPDTYAQQLTQQDLCSESELKSCVQEWNNVLVENFSKIDSYTPEQFHLLKQWDGYAQASDNITSWDTGVDVDVLKFIGGKSVTVPETTTVHPTIQKTHIDRRKKQIEAGTDLDWATAESLAIGSLLYQGFNVRISGQDVGRGTFSHRHAMIVDQESDDIYIPLNHISSDQVGYFEAANSVLSEEAVLGFEYGMSLEHPKNLVIWEAQFGDFFNGAQPIIDTYVTSGETKWLLQSGLVMLLPHGFDGAGPEHSSCRIERFLQLCDSKEDAIDGDHVNMEIVHPTTSGQYFHLLRRQMVRNYRKPLIVAAPKTLLRLSSAASSLLDMAPGTCYQPVLGDIKVNPESVTRLVFCSGKHFYALNKQRDASNSHNVAIIRLESLCPFPVADLLKEIKKYPKAKEFIWSQEEHRNMGPWSFVAPRFQNLLAFKLHYVGRGTLATAAVGIATEHQKEAQRLIAETFQ
ncbi:probable 2-oxoglutarate dehydrogenase E1 component DHKTD1, mitochondrial [Octopus vulgaris]|uniref:Probable 2-oxoglutarate dehydrogenase E1 component DHKTD1, mitochondrial n=1 Tax=Octopus vulgaris TaxID=6645 RepID=A0AA36AS94_OCTVU|nr:probable 2-oxoglutarate dehydrogenase E1 component DHKTD1, mitochondrial [Octopus vulgaris]